MKRLLSFLLVLVSTSSSVVAQKKAPSVDEIKKSLDSFAQLSFDQMKEQQSDISAAKRGLAQLFTRQALSLEERKNLMNAHKQFKAAYKEAHKNYTPEKKRQQKKSVQPQRIAQSKKTVARKTAPSKTTRRVTRKRGR